MLVKTGASKGVTRTLSSTRVRSRCLHLARDDEDELVPESEALFASVNPDVGVAVAAARAVGVSVAHALRSVPSRLASCTRPMVTRGWDAMRFRALRRSHASMRRKPSTLYSSSSG